MKLVPVLAVSVALVLGGCGSNHDEASNRPGTGVWGTVEIAAACPVETPTPCPAKAVEGVVTALRRLGEAVASVHTDAQGRFSLSLPPGSYLIFARELGDNPRISPFRRVTVRSGQALQLTLIIGARGRVGGG